MLLTLVPLLMKIWPYVPIPFYSERKLPVESVAAWDSTI